MEEATQNPPAKESSKRVVDFTECVFYRPGMYTTNGTLEEVGAFLEGYYSGLARGSWRHYLEAEGERWAKFHPWLAKTIGWGAAGWTGTVREMRKRYPDDVEAFEQLKDWYVEFLKSESV